jgi:hypothetical protein
MRWRRRRSCASVASVSAGWSSGRTVDTLTRAGARCTFNRAISIRRCPRTPRRHRSVSSFLIIASSRCITCHPPTRRSYKQGNRPAMNRKKAMVAANSSLRAASAAPSLQTPSWSHFVWVTGWVGTCRPIQHAAKPQQRWCAEHHGLRVEVNACQAAISGATGGFYFADRSRQDRRQPMVWRTMRVFSDFSSWSALI